MGRAVFTDDSGGRAVALTWLGRGLVLVSAALLCVLGVIVQTHVTVPPLERVWESGLRGGGRLMGAELAQSDAPAPGSATSNRPSTSPMPGGGPGALPGPLAPSRSDPTEVALDTLFRTELVGEVTKLTGRSSSSKSSGKTASTAPKPSTPTADKTATKPEPSAAGHGARPAVPTKTRAPAKPRNPKAAVAGAAKPQKSAAGSNVPPGLAKAATKSKHKDDG